MNKSASHLFFLGPRTSVNPENILFLEADVNYTDIHYQNGKIQTLSVTLKRVLKAIENEGSYVRISLKHAINKRCITSVSKDSVRIKGGTTLKASRRRKRLLEELGQTA
ncbi:LytTR family DNA-binding domain-containing protein [Jiulongibacter sediminis]|jgi:DNA-binding LytR/AlgR family response regulator|uniref:LytTR family DNA-binding domain-containing protein n=1 Tax=Jiulongibacter sediminis TaxID=1605367 RepID=UPI0026EA2C32|nr:LytTR family DNA-binding domain-containing protein [Jiulongibacter sediminis]